MKILCILKIYMLCSQDKLYELLIYSRNCLIVLYEKVTLKSYSFEESRCFSSLAAMVASSQAPCQMLAYLLLSGCIGEKMGRTERRAYELRTWSLLTTTCHHRLNRLCLGKIILIIAYKYKYLIINSGSRNKRSY